MFKTIPFVLTLASLAAFGITGCNPQPAPPPATDSHAHDHHAHEHGHATEGPHQGQLIELGNEEYHAELVHDEQAGKVIVYLLGADAKTAQPIAATELKLNLTVGGTGKQFTLPAAPLEGESQGQSSRFESTDEALHTGLDSEGVEGRLNVTIGDKPYVGEIHGHSHQ